MKQRTLLCQFLVLLCLCNPAWAQAQPKPEGEMRWALYVTLSPVWFDPAEVVGVLTPFWVLTALHDALVKPMPGNLLTPSLAESYRVRFHLHEPWPDFMTFYGTYATGAGWIAPKKYMEQVGPDGFKKHPI